MAKVSTAPTRIGKERPALKDSLSINRIMEQNAKQNDGPDEQQVATSSARDAFSMDQLNSTWEAYAYSIEAKNPDIFATLLKYPIELEEECEILLKIDNSAQDHQINQISPELLSFIRKRLNNYGITLQTQIIKDEKQKTPYTGLEKFNKLAEKNPMLQKLKELLDLTVQ